MKQAVLTWMYYPITNILWTLKEIFETETTKESTNIHVSVPQEIPNLAL